MVLVKRKELPQDMFSKNAEDISEEEQSRLQLELADVPFDVLMQVKRTGSAVRGARLRAAKVQKVKSKNEPQELPAKKQVSRVRETVHVTKQRPRDPRFEPHIGDCDERRFKHAYEFVFKENLPADRKRLKKLLNKERRPDVKEQLQRSLASVETHLKRNEEWKRSQALASDWKQKRKEAVKAGKQPFYLKKGDVRKLELVEKYKELKASGKLEAFLAKRRKKNAAKEHKSMPHRRVAVD